MKENNENINNLENPDNYGANIDDVVITGYSLGTDKKYHMDHYLEPNYWGKSLARAVNSGYIDEDQIQMNPDKLKRDYFETGADFRRAKRNLRHNRRQFNKARKYAGSDQQSAADREFYHKLGVATTGIVGSLPAAYATGTLLGAGIYGAPWIATNIALPLLGGEVLNETTRKVSDGYYNSFGDFVYRSTPLDNWTRDTWAETPVKFLADMINPGYWAPYRKVAGYAMDGFKSLSSAYNNLPVKIKFTPRVNFRYRNIGGDNEGINDLITSGVVNPLRDVKPQIVNGINLRKQFTKPYFGYTGTMVDAKAYPGKWFVGAEDIGQFYRPKRNEWGYVSRTPLTYDNVTINRRIFPRMTNSPYIEWLPGEFNTPNLNKELLLSLEELPRIVDVYGTGAKPWQLTKKQFNKIIHSNKSTNELLKRILQSRYQFARGVSNLLDHNLDDFAQYLDRGSNLLPGARGGGRYDLDPFDFLGIPSEGVWYGTNNLGYASRFPINDKKIPFEHGGMGIVRIKDAVFNGHNRHQWINDNPIPIIDDQGMFSLNGMVGRKVPNSSGMYDTYIFKGNYGSKVGEVVKTYNPKEISNYFEQLKLYPSTIDVVHWKHGGKLCKKQ